MAWRWLERGSRRDARLGSWAYRLGAIVLFCTTFFAGATACASVAVLVEQPYGEFGAWNPTGHSALYFDHLCAATPVELRPCRPGELGVVVSRYDGIAGLDWVAVPLVPYLYAVKNIDDVPGRVSRLDVLRMRDLYRRDQLETVAPDTPEGGMPQGNWYQLAGAAYDRAIYGFEVRTTADQDARIMALLNDRPNVERYSGAFRNCADFVRTTLDRIYPHAVRRNFIADFGMTTPKSVARELVHYAHRHPGTELTEFRIPQVAGDLPRSVNIEGVTESLLKRYGVPLTFLSPHITAAVLVAYVGGHGRFAMPKEAPLLDFHAMEAVNGVAAPVIFGPAAQAVPGSSVPAEPGPATLAALRSETAGDMPFSAVSPGQPAPGLPAVPAWNGMLHSVACMDCSAGLASLP